MQKGVEKLLAGTTGRLQGEVVETLAALKIDVNEGRAVGWASDAKADVNLRAAALKLLADRKAKPFDALAAAALKSGPPALAAAVRDIVAEKQPDAATKMRCTPVRSPRAATRLSSGHAAGRASRRPARGALRGERGHLHAARG